MGDFGDDTSVERVGDGQYRATLSQDWAIWGPCGGYVAAVGLRAAGAASSFDRPASFACHYLGVAKFTDVDIEVTSLRAGRRSESLRVSMTQGERSVAELLVWATDDSADGVEVDWTTSPHRPPHEFPTIQELVPDWESWYPFWDNFEYRPKDWKTEEDWEAGRPFEPRWESWFRYVPTAVFDDPWTEAGRVSLIADIAFWPAVSRAIPPEQGDNWMAPSLDLAVTMHQLPRGSEYLWLDATAPIATDSLGGGTAQVWSQDGRLLCSATQQLLFREMDPDQRSI